MNGNAWGECLRLEAEKNKGDDTEKKIEARISELLRERIPKETLDIRVLEKWVKADKSRKKARYRKCFIAAGCAAAVCFWLKYMIRARNRRAAGRKWGRRKATFIKAWGRRRRNRGLKRVYNIF